MLRNKNSLVGLGVVLLVGLVLAVVLEWIDVGSISWREEVLLHDGTKIIVTRMVSRGDLHALNHSAPYKKQTLSFSLPGTNQIVRWEDNYSKDLRATNFLPMAIDIYQGVIYLVVRPMGCLSYNKWGRPNPPNILFKFDGQTWQKSSLHELPVKTKRPNLIFSMPVVEVERMGTRFVSAEKIQNIVSGYNFPENRSILRTPGQTSLDRCPDLMPVGYGWAERK